MLELKKKEKTQLQWTAIFMIVVIGSSTTGLSTRILFKSTRISEVEWIQLRHEDSEIQASIVKTSLVGA